MTNTKVTYETIKEFLAIKAFNDLQSKHVMSEILKDSIYKKVWGKLVSKKL